MWSTKRILAAGGITAALLGGGLAAADAEVADGTGKDAETADGADAANSHADPAGDVEHQGGAGEH